jgi:hypothetical protein
MRPRTLRILALSYAVKTLLIGIAWVLVPDLPERAIEALRATLTAGAPASAP